VCNPRRVEITATRQMSAAWTREIRRAASVQLELAEEARIIQAIGDSVGRPVLAYLGRMLADGAVPGWHADGPAYRFTVDGGHARYDPETGALEIVALAAATVLGRSEAQVHISGQVDAELTARGDGRWYDDEWNGHTEARAREAAALAAESALDAEAARRLAAAAAAAETTHADALQSSARTQAEAEAARLAAPRRAELQREAVTRLEQVGVRARQAFFRLLARAYSEALQGLARTRGAEGLQVREDDDTLEIEFLLPKG